MVAAFALGSLGAFLPFEWPPLLREIVFEYLLSFLILRIILVFGRFVLAPGGPKYRILPMEIPAAWFWYRRLAAFFGWTVFVRASMRLIETLGVNEDVRRLVGIACMLVILAILTEVAWRRPRPAPDSPAEAARPPSAWLATGYFAVLWLMFIAGTGPRPIFWLAVIAVTLPAAIRLTRRAVNNLFRPANVATAEDEAPSVAAVCLDRGLQAVLIIGSTVFLAHQWDIDLIELTARDTVATRLLRGTLSAVVIILVADFAWRLMKVLIDRKLMGVDAEGRLDEDEVRRRARMRTLLPIIRNVVFVILIVMVVLMVLASLGIDIGPLIAGAGVVGVAIGFGAQTLVKDVISGIFYLIDDAFRVGEYVQSAQHKGTVESFSLRSVKLRHHRGPLTTVPFGELGAIQNMSRDWVIDKLQIGVTYDTDIDKAKKLIKEIGKALAADPEFAPHILETLKMQGVENFGDFAINLRLKMKTKPGEQFVIRRRTYALIKKAFDANGIKFAYQTVQIAGNGDAQPAVAQAAIDMTRPPAVT
jgi:small-conductance mechanosensitive channel